MRPTSVLVAGAAAAVAAAQNVTGEAKCIQLMCISGTVNGSDVQYVLQSTGAAKLGWMAIGFGTQMANTPMVIMWPNSDGSFTLSQRQAPGEVEPSVVSNPPRTATLTESLSSSSGTNPKLAFTIPKNSDTQQQLIWAFGTVNPDSSAADAQLQQHLQSASGFVLDLTQPIDSSNTTYIDNPALSPSSSSSGSGNGSSSSGSPSSSGGGGGGSVSLPLAPFEKLIVAHGILLAVGFLFLLPVGALWARYLRTFTTTWFRGHMLVQLALAGPVIVTGVALGIAAVSQAGAPHLNDDHKRWGIAIFVLYFVQLLLGAAIHWLKPAHTTRRPPQNYVHAIIGLLIIGLAFYQVRTGYRVEWPTTTGRPALPMAVNSVWIAWVVIVPVLYFAGLLLLRRQFKQERASAAAGVDGQYPKGRMSADTPTYQ